MASRAPIDFPLDAAEPHASEASQLGGMAQEALDQIMQAQARSAKYGTDVSDKPSWQMKAGPLRDAKRKQEAFSRRPALAVGFDMYSDDELAKRRSRAARFGRQATDPTVSVSQRSEEELARKRRAEKYGTTYAAVNPSGLDSGFLKEQKQDAATESVKREDALHVYGVDLLGTRDLISYFREYGGTFVEWINDSSCNVCFPDKFAVKRVLVELGEVLPDDDASAIEGIDLADTRLTYLWYRGKVAATKDGVSVPLVFRVATTADVKDYLSRPKSRHLWTMPAPKAIQRATNPESKRKRGMDEDGDTIMDERGSQRRNARRKKVRKQELLNDSQRSQQDGSTFLNDDDRSADGPHSYFLALDAEEQAVEEEPWVPEVVGEDQGDTGATAKPASNDVDDTAPAAASLAGDVQDTAMDDT